MLTPHHTKDAQPKADHEVVPVREVLELHEVVHGDPVPRPVRGKVVACGREARAHPANRTREPPRV